MDNTIDMICILILIIIGLGFIGWGIAQTMYLVPPCCGRWSDLFGMVIGMCFMTLAYLFYLDPSIQRQF